MEVKVSISNYRHNNKSSDFFKEIDFCIDKNGIYCLLGSSGVGKTTLMNIMLGLNHGELSGNVNYVYDEVNYSPSELREKGVIGYQPQDFCLIPWLNVNENLLIPAKVNSNLKKPNKSQLIENILKIGLDESILAKDMYPHKLSFGMKARIGLIRATIYNPRILFIDELFTGVDYINNLLIGQYLQEISSDTIILSISHDIKSAMDISKELFIMDKNRKLIRDKEKSFTLDKILTHLDNKEHEERNNNH